MSEDNKIETIQSNNEERLQNIQLGDKEEIRRRLAFDLDDDDDPIAQYKQKRKSRKSLTTRMQNIDTLQICFLNENTETFTFEDLANHSSIDNNNDIIMQNRTYYLFKRLEKQNFELNTINLFEYIEKPTDKAKFLEFHSKLYTEAKLVLSQIKEICKLRNKIEKENQSDGSPSIYDLIHNLPHDFQKNVTKLNRPILDKLRICELQLIVNDMFTQIEKSNGDLVRMLMKRDELYMEQDSLLVDIEDLTKFLLSK